MIVPVPRTAGDDVSQPPAIRREWVAALGQVSGLLLALREEEADGTVPPDPLADGVALRAWAAVTRPASLHDPDSVIRPEDLALVARTACVLGGSVCRWRAGGHADVLTNVLRREAAVHGRAPEWLVAQLARVHGVLSAPDPVAARLVWRALEDGGPSPTSVAPRPRDP